MTDADKINAWLDEHRITEIECMVPDMTGIPRGKIIPRHKYDPAEGIRMAEAVFTQTVTGNYPEDDFSPPTDPDMRLIPDPNTLRMVPWAAEPTAQIIHDGVRFDGSPVDIAPRNVLKRVLNEYARLGLKPVIAPEMEFYLVQTQPDEDLPLEPPVGRTHRTEAGRQSFSIDAMNDYDDIFDVMYDWCEEQDLGLDTLIHEMGPAQMEINLDHGDPLLLADQVFIFKRTIREVAIRNNMYATFMAKPMQGQPGSAMHMHQSVVDINTGKNIFSDDEGNSTEVFFNHIAGLQKYLPAAMPFLAPFVNSYRRLSRFTSAPINLEWGYDNRTCGLRVPESNAAGRRVENRLAGVDVNPYLAFAASLGAGLLGMQQQLLPTQPLTSSGYDKPKNLPRHLDDAVAELLACEPLHELLGTNFVKCYAAIKETEFEEFFEVISPWERRYLLLQV
ncbi:glutamine synthetase family protein [Snodgrassella sp. CFCC 13594]|uniref:glutamine synthetase family protein n=1 Tax=Snodgrassella sp. CFCC 13594 TaxID=1775559 RepID=UPI00082E4E80|nr:glutamine synthetase family protein [Snodgrassella sp. CFCC 13594]